MSMHSGMNRRDFLRRAVVTAGAAVAAPLFIPASAMGRGGAIAPSERIAMGFIGVGGQGGGHLIGGAWTYLTGGYAARKDVQVVSICDIRRERREYCQQQVNKHYEETYGAGSYSPAKAVIDFREVLADKDIDAVLIATPAHWHATMTVMAVQAGKDVYCEKPTAGTIEESQAVTRAIKRYGRVYQGGTQQRTEYNSIFRRAAEYVQSGRIGKIKQVYGYRDGGLMAWPSARFSEAQPLPDPNDLHWDLFLGPAPALPYDGNINSHRFDIGELNWGQHHADVIQWCCGKDGTCPTEHWVDPAAGCNNYRYADGIEVYGKPFPGEVVGYDGGACIIGTEGRIAFDRANIVSYPEAIIRDPLTPGEVHLHRETSHSGNFLDCVRTRKQPIVHEDIAHYSVSNVILGGIVKLVNGSRPQDARFTSENPLRWDPAAERFPDDAEANRLLTLSKRAPWHVV